MHRQLTVSLGSDEYELSDKCKQRLLEMVGELLDREGLLRHVKKTTDGCDKNYIHQLFFTFDDLQ